MPATISPRPGGAATLPRDLPLVTTIHGHALSRITALATAAHEGSLLIIGAAGAGKSHLLAAVDLSTEVAIYHVRINPAEAALPHSGLSAIVSSFHCREAVELSGKLLSSHDGDAGVAAQAAELLVFIHDFIESPTLLLIDDVDEMDHASQVILTMVATRLGGTGLCIVGTASLRPSAGPLASLPRLELGRLDSAQSTAFARDLADSPADDAVIRIVVNASSGNPQALAHSVRRLTPRQLAGDAPLSLPLKAVRHGNSAESASASREIIARLACACVSSQAAIAQEFGNSQEVLEDLISDGSVTRTGRYLSIADPLVRSRVYWSLDAVARREFHSAAAKAEATNEPGLAAWHRSMAGNRTATADELLAAAAEFASQGLVWSAVELAERALSVDHNSLDGPAGLFRVSQALFQRGELTFAARYARIGQRRAGGAAVAPRMAILRTDIEFMSSQRLLTADVDDWVSMSGGENPDDAAYVLSTIALYHAERWEIDAARESLTRARALLDGCSPATVDAYGRAAMVLAAFGGDPGPANAVFDRVSRHGVASTPIPTLAWLGRALSSLDRHTEARRIFTAIINLEPAPDPVWLQTTRYWHAEDEILAGNQVEAMAAIDELEGTTADIRLHQCTRQLLMAWYWQVRGNRAESEAAIAECHRSFAAGDNPALTARLAAYQGGFALAEKRFEDAIAFLRMAASIGEGFRNPTMQRYRVDLIEAYAASGRLAEANEQLRQLRRETQTRPTRWSNLATSRATALVTPGQPGIAAFQQAIRSWHPGDPQYELGRAVLGYAEHLRALGQLPESREQFLTARMIFTQLGATSWVRKSESAAPLNEAPREHPLLASLAPDERLVADLVCQGLRNKEIAARLFVSLRTVEVRLTRIYQKVGARSRAHLTAMLATSETVIGAGRTAS